MRLSGSQPGPDAAASGRPVSRVGVRAALALALPCLSLTLVFTTPSTAQALSTATPEPITIGTAVKSPPGRVVTSSVKKASLGRFAKAGQIAMLLWDTKDVWWPSEKQNDPGKEADRQTSTSSAQATCTVTASNLRLNRRLDGTASTGYAVVTTARAGNNGGCTTSAGALRTTLSVNVTYASRAGESMSPTQLTSRSLAVSGTSNVSTSEVSITPGQELAYVKVTPAYDPTFTNAVSQEAWAAVPDSDYVQEARIKCERPDGTEFSLEKEYRGFPGRIMIPSCRQIEPLSFPKESTITGGPVFAPDKPQLLTTGIDREAFEDYGDCLTGGLKCEIRVHVDGQPCSKGDARCADWEQVEQDAPARVRCMFGAYTLTIADCDDLKRRYRTDVSSPPVTELKPDGTPKTEPETPTSPTTGTNPSTPPLPTTGANPQTPRVKPDSSTDPDSQSCYSDAWSWNPVDWVYVPVKCALQWAFVPPASGLKTLTTTLEAGWRDTTPGRWATAVTGLAPEGAVSGCQGPRVNYVAMGTEVDFYPLDACSGTRAMVAGVSRVVASVLVIFGGFFASLRALGSGLGWDPRVGEKIT